MSLDSEISDEEIVYHSSINNVDSSGEFDPEVDKITVPPCTICYRTFNKAARTPMIITNCGHSVCSECLNKIDTCPICRCNIDDTVVNWVISSELSLKNKKKINPFYKIIIDFKKEIELDYLKYPDTPDDIEFESLSTSQKKLINKIKYRIRDVEIKDFMIETLLIPMWIKIHIKECVEFIKNYRYRLIYHDIQDLEEQLPFCP